ncbi:DUF4435 domain-containing protein [Pedobacter sp. AJM]|uniref:DUF4435 domain-containing protein n=1 Tax=Pedobacter sp. AJM TaxID=2003629 RepID=UPI000B4BA3B3|nr:DUF4435 domain-containing protein [Pedobacter sp. AJM]OWK68836.1 hypothetical protein CBW18_20420 [Pedobacter sp. AJM]
MAGFRRTNKGISNLHLFYNVDVIVYLEGGSKSYSKHEVYQNSFSSDTEDIAFWSRLFKRYRSAEKLKYKSVGSKQTLKEIAEDLLSGAIDNIYIAMDNEFDEVHNKRIIHDNIFYTYGYSYENDVWNLQTVLTILEDLTATNVDYNYIEKGVEKFEKEIRKAVVADSYMFKKGKSFFPRKKGHLFCVECNLDNLPIVKIAELNKMIINLSLNINTLKSHGYKNKIQVLKHCFGHLLADFFCQIINHYLKVKHGFASMRKEILYRMAIKSFFDKQYKNSDLEAYYQAQFT